MVKTKIWPVLLCAIVAGIGGAHAGDLVAEEAAPVTADEAAEGSPYGSLIIGLSGTTDYIVGGLTQTDNKPAIQPFIEYSTPFGIYAGLWGSNVDFGPGTDDNWEIDAYAGYRNTFDKLSVDVSYWRYYYDQTGYYGDTAIVGLDYQLTEKVKLGSSVKFDFELDDQIISPRATFTPIESWSISGKFEFAQESPNKNWDIGVTKAFNDVLSADLRYYDSNFGKPRIVLSLTAAIDAFQAFGN